MKTTCVFASYIPDKAVYRMVWDSRGPYWVWQCSQRAFEEYGFEV